MKTVKEAYLFVILAMEVLPEHLHSTLHSYIKRGMAASDWSVQTGGGIEGYGER